MAKSTKPKAAAKKVEPVIETPKEETVQVGALSAKPEDSEAAIIDIPKSEAIEKGLIEPVPPSVTLEEVEQVKEIIEPVKEESKVVAEAVVDNIVFPISQPEEEMPMEQKIINFIESRGAGEIKMNDFLKSLFEVPKFNEPPVYLRQGSNRQLRSVLIKLQSEGKINIENNRHLRLGQSYYKNSEPETKYYNLNTVQIVAKK